MIVRVFDDNYEKYYCTLCNRPFKAMREATEHAGFCGQAVPIQPVFRSYTTEATFELEDDDIQTYAVPWQGLTDEEYKEILKQHDGTGLLAFYNLVEAKLKEKNT